LLEREPPTTTLRGGSLELLHELGEGAMATVFLARQLPLDREVAVKIAPPASPELRRRILREASAMARLAHPNVLRIFDVGEEDGHVYLVMEHARGGTLANVLPVSEERAIELGVALADALAHAHAHGVIHCDLKPENVLLDGEGRPLLADFGIARLRPSATATDVNRGTPYFAAPEVLEGHAPDARSDLFSLGVLLYCAMRGRLPVVGVSEPIDGPLGREIARAMSASPAERHASAAALRDALVELQRPRASLSRRPRARRAPWVLALAAAVAGALGATWLALSPAASADPAGAWHLESEAIDGRGAGRFVMQVARDGDHWLMDYQSGVMRCALEGARCSGVWYGRSGDGWLEIEFGPDGRTFAGRWGYRGDRTRHATMRGTRVGAATR
jgi:hypothetical protein